MVASLEKTLEVKIYKSSMAEIDAELKDVVKNGIINKYLPGKLIQLKDDIILTWHYRPNQKDLEVITKKDLTNLERMLDQAGETALKKYKESATVKIKTKTNKTISVVATNVEKAQGSYQTVLEDIYKAMSEAVDEDTAAIKKLADLYDFMMGGITVKEYSAPSPFNKGFHAGSLGAEGKIISNNP